MNDAKPILGEDTIFGRLYYQDADYDALRAELAELRDRLDVMTQCADNYSRMFEESSEQRDTTLAQLAAIQGGMGDEPLVVATAILGGVFHGVSRPELGDIDVEVCTPHLEKIQCETVNSSDDVFLPLMTVAQHNRIVAALSAQQSEPERVSVPVELLERTICRLTNGHEHDKAVRELRALLASAEGVKDE